MMSATESIPSAVEPQLRTAQISKKEIAWRTTQTLLISVGGMGTIAFMASLQRWLALTGVGWITITWLVLYRLLLSVAQRSR
jgi:hypothetical protein